MSTTNINTVTLDEVETRAVREARRKTNEARAAAIPPLPEIPTNKAFLEWLLDNVSIPSFVAAEAAENTEFQAVKTAWKTATDAKRAAALAALA